MAHFAYIHVEGDQVHSEGKSGEEIWNIDWNIVIYCRRNWCYKIWQAIFVAMTFYKFFWIVSRYASNFFSIEPQDIKVEENKFYTLYTSRLNLWHTILLRNWRYVTDVTKCHTKFLCSSTVIAHFSNTGLVYHHCNTNYSWIRRVIWLIFKQSLLSSMKICPFTICECRFSCCACATDPQIFWTILLH